MTSAAKKGYDSKWGAYSKRFLLAHPWCKLHASLNQHVRATVVDHVTPHKGDKKLFWDPKNHQPLCASCHSGPKQAQERGGVMRLGCDAHGNPLDPKHHWNLL